MIRRLLQNCVVCCAYIALIPCLLSALWGVLILTSVTGVRRWSPSWASVEAPVTFDTRTEQATTQLRLSDIASLPSIQQEEGPRRHLHSGDDVDILLLLTLEKEDKESEVFHAQTVLRSNEGGKLHESLVAVTGPTAHNYLEFFFKIWKFPSQLLLHFQNRAIVEIVLIEHYSDRETEPLVSIDVTLMPRYAGQIPKIYAAAICVSKNLGHEFKSPLPVVYLCVVTGLLDRWLYRLRPSDSISFVWMMSGMSLVLASVIAAWILCKVAHWFVVTGTKGVASNKTPPRAEPVSGRGHHPSAGSPSILTKSRESLRLRRSEAR